MRMRKKKNLVPRMERCGAFLIRDPYDRQGHWRDLMPQARELRLELGCGKGGFLARLASALSLFLASGVDADTALTAASDMVEHQGLRAQLQACHEEMQKGKGLSTALFEQKVFEPLYGRMLISGARSGQADTVLARLSQLFTQDAQAAMDALIDSIEPILAAFLTLAVGVTLLAVMLPLIGILGSIG